MGGLWRYDKARKRTWILGARIHHGLAGLAMFVAGAWLMWDDRHDAPWLSDPDD